MIRINLLPEAKRTTSSGGSSQLWGVLYLLAAFAWGVVLFLVYLSFNSRLDEQNTKNAELQEQIDRAKAQAQNIGEVEAALAKSKELETVVSDLQAARSGPARVLMELAKVLSEGGGPTVSADELDAMRRDNPMMVFSAGWDVRRLWIESYLETKHKCTIVGYGRSNEDVAEFLRRLNISEVFDKVTLQATTAALDDKGANPTVRFNLTCEVRY